MSRLLGQIIATLSRDLGGQHLLELPDDLPASFVINIAAGANESQQSDIPYALLVHSGRKDLSSAPHSVDLRELARYRTEQRLAITYASDNRGMTTYSSVFPALFSSSFPEERDEATHTGAATLSDLVSAAAVYLSRKHGRSEVPDQSLLDPMLAVANFETAICIRVGNLKSSLAADWWMLFGNWLEALEEVLAQNTGFSDSALCYGAAGLPRPRDPAGQYIDPAAYVRTLQARWSDAPSVRRELARLSIRPEAQTAVERLSKIDWETEFQKTGLDTDSPVAKIALAGVKGAARFDRSLGWASITETAIGESFDSGKLQVLREDCELPRPWRHGEPVLLAEPGEDSNGTGNLLIFDGITLVLPWKEESSRSPVPSDWFSDLNVSGLKSCEVKFQPASFLADPSGLKVSGRLVATLAAKAPGLLAIKAVVSGKLAMEVADEASATVTVVRSNQVVAYLAPVARTRKSEARGPSFWRKGDNVSSVLSFSGSGSYDVAVVAGAASGIDHKSLVAAGQPVGKAWPGMETANGFVCATVALSGPASVGSGDQSTHLLEPEYDEAEPYSPLLAAATGTRPNQGNDAGTGLLPLLDREMTAEYLSLGTVNHALGALLTIESPSAPADLSRHASGALASKSLLSRKGELNPGYPTRALTDSPEFLRLVKAYQALELGTLLSAAEGLSISRLPIDKIAVDKVTEIVTAYVALVDASLQMEKPGDRFWARHPFSVATYRDGSGNQECTTILLSPLHPIRFAWLWQVQLTLRAGYEDGARPLHAMAFLDPASFPVVGCVVDPDLGSMSAYCSVPIDPAPHAIYVGWHALVIATNGWLLAPEWVNGQRFPASGLSGLSSGAVTSALDDFLRVSPHVRALVIELTSPAPANRSTSIDAGIVDKVGQLARGSETLEGIASVRVVDSPHRRGTPPSVNRLNDDLALASSNFAFEWGRRPVEGNGGPHLTFLEGSAITVKVGVSAGPQIGWLPKAPFRRFPQRIRTPNGRMQLSYAIAPLANDFLSAALRAYESKSTSEALVIQVQPNIGSLPNRPDWLVTGDFGIDPENVTRACTENAEGRYMLWDWRPCVASSQRGVSSGGRTQPYLVLAAIPAALTSAIVKRVEKLRPGLSKDEVAHRVATLVRVLSERAIGLNTLLSIGHHQASGALGFFFALQSAQLWVLAAPVGEQRTIIPVDAVDPLLRTLAGSSPQPEETTRRADLLAVTIRMSTESNEVQIIFTPIEIKHYGLMAESPTAFLPADHASLASHLDQLGQYGKQLASMSEAFSNATAGASSLMALQLAAALESSLQLSPAKMTADSARALCAVCEGRARLLPSEGVLVWYQSAASNSGSGALWDYVSTGVPHSYVRVDPCACDDHLWSKGKNGIAHEVFTQAICHVITAAAANTTATHPAPPGTLVPPEPHSRDIAEGAPTGRADGDAPPVAVAAPHTIPPDTGEAGQPPRPAPAIEVAPRRKLDDAALTERYRIILATLGEFGVKVTRPQSGQPGFIEGPAFIEFALTPGYGIPVRQIEAQHENLKLRLRLPSSASIGFRTHLGNVLVTVPKAEDERYFISAREMWSRWSCPPLGFHIPIGEDIRGDLISLELSHPNSPHFLLAGSTGGGKSEALLTLLRGAAHFYGPDRLRLLMVDPKGTELTPLRALPHCLNGIASSAEDAIDLLNNAAEEMDRRYKAFAENGARDIDELRAKGILLPRWMIVLDEYADLIHDAAAQREVEASLKRVAQKARAAGIHVVISTQKPIVAVVNTVIRGSLPGRIALRVVTAAESRVILDETGAEDLTGKGDALLKVGARVTRLQFAKFSD